MTQVLNGIFYITTTCYVVFNVSDSDGERKHYDPEIQENLNHQKMDHVSTDSHITLQWILCCTESLIVYVSLFNRCAHGVFYNVLISLLHFQKISR